MQPIDGSNNGPSEFDDEGREEEEWESLSESDRRAIEYARAQGMPPRLISLMTEAALGHFPRGIVHEMLDEVMAERETEEEAKKTPPPD